MLNHKLRLLIKGAGAGAGMLLAGYAAYAGIAWMRYGHAAAPAADDADPLLDRFMPEYDIVERHHVRVAAPADVALQAAEELDLMQSRLVRAIFKGREMVLGADADAQSRPRGLLALTEQLGWGVLAESAGREIVMGAVTQPWKANVVFRALPPEEFAAFDEPDYVKIVWTLRADPVSAAASISRTETRAVATDAAARAKFRRYWAGASPGITLIRWVSVGLVKRDAERRFRERFVPAASLERRAG